MKRKNLYYPKEDQSHNIGTATFEVTRNGIILVEQGKLYGIIIDPSYSNIFRHIANLLQALEEGK